MNGLLSDYFAGSSDLSAASVERLFEVAAELHERPRKTLGWPATRAPVRKSIRA